MMRVTLAVVAATIAVLPVSATAGTAQAQFGITLVIEPACAGDAPKLVPSADAAIELASSFLGVPPHTLGADHDHRATGFWLVRSDQGAVLRIEKCTGAVSLAEAQKQSARSLTEPGASPTSG